MDKVTGRISDMFTLNDGSKVHGERFTHFFKYKLTDVETFQVHQTAIDKAVVRVVPTESCDRDTFSAEMLKQFREYTKGQMQFEVQFVDSIPKEASGKYRFTKSDVLLKRR